MKHSNAVLLQAIALAGNQTKLAKILQIQPSQLSAWLHTDGINMPIKYGDLIEIWSNNQILKRNLFPDLRDLPIVNRKISITEQLETLIYMAKSQNLDIIINVSLSKKELQQPKFETQHFAPTH